MIIKRPDEGRAWFYREQGGGVALVFLGEQMDWCVKYSDRRGASGDWGVEVSRLTVYIRPVPFPEDVLNLEWPHGEEHLVVLRDGRSAIAMDTKDERLDPIAIAGSYWYRNGQYVTSKESATDIVADLGRYRRTQQGK